MLFLSRLHPQKGMKLLLRALHHANVDLDQWQLILVGPEDYSGYLEELRQLVSDAGLSDAVAFVGPVYGQDKDDAYAAADLFLLPTRSDSFSIAVAEALVRGVPVLTTEGAHPWWRVREHDCGWWVPRRLSSLVSALHQATSKSDHELRAMGSRGQALVKQEFLWSHAAGKTIQLYNWLLGRAQRPGFVVPSHSSPRRSITAEVAG
jgi:glycosyltransferase involved in cell wall biosynthesis